MAARRSLKAVPDNDGYDASGLDEFADGGDVGDPTRVDEEDLAGAASAALQNTGAELELSGEQTAIMPACKMRFQGMAWDSLDEVPPLKAELTFLVTARVVGHETKVNKDGELRELAKGDVVSVKLVNPDGSPIR